MIRVHAWLVILLAATGCTAAPSAGFWPQWRGPQRDNVSRETGLLKEWPPGGPPLAWVVEGVGKGTSSVAVRGGRVFLLGYVGEREFVTALDEESGRRLWATPIGGAVEEHPSMRWLSPRTPTVDSELIFAFRGDGKLVCLRTVDGSEVWRKDYISEYGAERHMWGQCDYPLVDGDRLICAPCGTKATFVALDKKTGHTIWTTRVEGPALQAFGATIVGEIAGVRQYVAQSHAGVFGLRDSNGATLWQVLSNSSSNDHPVSSTALLVGDRIFMAARWVLPLRIIRVTSGPAGLLAEVVTSRRSPAGIHDDSLVAVGDHLYGVSPIGLYCLKGEDGGDQWKEMLGRDLGALTFADGRIYHYAPFRRVSLIEPSPERLKIISSFFPQGPARQAGASSPVVTGGRLYLRDEDQVLCYDVRSSGPTAPPTLTVLEPPGDRTKLPPAAFVATPGDVVQKMLDLAGVQRDGLLYDLGSGDGRILIAAATRGMRAVGIEIDPELVALSEAKLAGARIRERVIVSRGDLFTVDLSRADVVAVYLPEEFLRRLIPMFEKMKPGSRIVSHQFKIPGMIPDQSVEMTSSEDPLLHTIHVWTVPLKAVR